MKVMLDPDEMLSNHHLERGLRGSRAWGGIVDDKTVSFLP
jgi:hypothetical protein